MRFLQNAQNGDGGFSADGNAGEPSDPEFTAWAAIGLAAAGINPQNQARQGGESAYTYLVDHVNELAATTDFERVLLVVDAAGTSAQDFGGVNLIQAILHRQLAGRRFRPRRRRPVPRGQRHGLRDPRAQPDPGSAVQEAIGRAVKWLESEQNSRRQLALRVP